MIFSKNFLLLYGITDRAQLGSQTLSQKVEAAILGGATIIQLREKSLDNESFIREAVEIGNICHNHNIPLIINDNVEVALKSGADGVHVGAEDKPVAEIRKYTGKDFIIGATAKTVAQAKLAEKSGADYLGVGAVFPSPTKRNAIRITNEQLREISSAVNFPVVAIGGINKDNITKLKGSGIDGVAVVSAIFSADNPKAAATELAALSKSILSGASLDKLA